MIIKSLSFANFKSFSADIKSQTLKKLDILTLLYGENNSGKSNLLKFINLLFRSKVELQSTIKVGGESIATPTDTTAFWKGRITSDAFLFHKNDRTKRIPFETTVALRPEEISKLEYAKSIVKELEISGNSFDVIVKGSIRSLADPYESEIVLESVEWNGKKIYDLKEGAPRYFQGIESLKNDAITFENLMSVLGDSILFLDHNRFLNKENENNSDLVLTPANFKNWLHNLTLDPLKYSKYLAFLDFIKKHSIPGNTGKVLNHLEPTYSKKENVIDVFLKSNSERLPIGSFGTGIMQILLILAMIFETKAKIVLIEELELNLSPTSQQEFYNVLAGLVESKQIDQVIITSHSEMLSKTPGLSVYEVSLSEQGVSKVTFKDTPSKKFFARKSATDKQMASVVRKHGVKGPEWD